MNHHHVSMGIIVVTDTDTVHLPDQCSDEFKRGGCWQVVFDKRVFGIGGIIRSSSEAVRATVCQRAAAATTHAVLT